MLTPPARHHAPAAGACALGLVMAGLFWATFSGPFPLAEFCTRNRPTWVLPLFERPRYTAVGGWTFLAATIGLSLAYLAALRLTRGVRGPWAAGLLLGVLPIVFLLVLVPGYPLLSSDIFKYVFDGRILAVYGQNPFLHVPAEFPQDRFYDLVYWKAVVNAHGPIWRALEAASAAAGGESCRTAILAMKVWPSVAYLATVGALFAMLRASDPERAVSGTLLYAWNPLVLLEALQNGHNDVVATLPTLGAVWLAGRGRPLWVFPLLAVAALVKPLALVLGPLLLVATLRSRLRRQAGLSLAIGGGLVAAAYVPFWAGPATLQGLARASIFSASPAELLLLALQAAGLGLERAMPIVSATANGLYLLALVPLLRAAASGRLALPAAAFGVFFLYLLIAAQWFNPWYLLWLAPWAALAPFPPRVLGVAFTLLAPLVYLLQYAALPTVLVVFLPLAMLALRWRAWLGWPGQLGAGVPAAGRRWQMANGG